MLRMRLVDKAYDEFKKLDPETDITRCAFRRIVKRGDIPSYMVGNRRLVNLDEVVDFFQQTTVSVQMQKPDPVLFPKIRKVAEK